MLEVMLVTRLEDTCSLNVTTNFTAFMPTDDAFGELLCSYSLPSYLKDSLTLVR